MEMILGRVVSGEGGFLEVPYRINYAGAGREAELQVEAIVIPLPTNDPVNLQDCPARITHNFYQRPTYYTSRRTADGSR
jgi:hypothetical protein